MKQMVLLGAGASTDAGVPAAFDMTERLVELLDNNSKHSHVIRFVVGGLLMEKARKGRSPFEGVNVEDVFNMIQLLGSRHDLEADAFIGAWHPRVGELDTIHLSAPLPHPDLTKINYRLSRYHDFDRALEDAIHGKRPTTSPGQIVAEIAEGESIYQRWCGGGMSPEPVEEAKDIPGEGKIFQQTNDLMTRKLVEMVWIDNQERLRHLLPLLQSPKEDLATIATLNYDNTVERAAELAGIVVKTGIEEWSASGTFPESQDGIYLLKLHGSIDWQQTPGAASPDRPLPHQTISKTPEVELKKPGFRPAVIFGQRNKLTAKGPFLDLLRLFRERLHEADLLTVIGYSFRDEHVNEYIRQWFNSATTRKIRIINGPNFHKTTTEFAQQLMRVKERVADTKMSAKEGIMNLFGPNAGESPSSHTV